MNQIKQCTTVHRSSVYPSFKSHIFLVSTFLFANLTFISYSHTAPAGGQVVGGAGTINQAGLTTTVKQNTKLMAIDWQSYNVQQNERVQYIQPSSSSISLNRILGNNASTIRGQIDANGQVILVNPNGIFFGANSTVNVGGLIASGLDISPTDFMNGNYIFNEVLGKEGTVVNSGIINAATGGSVSLLGKQVKNEGMISAKLGTVNMAAGKAAVVTFDNAGLLGIKVTKEVLQNGIGVDPAVLNSGTITAEGGNILLTASVSQDIFSRAVNTGTLEQATSAVVHPDGTFTLGGGADVVNSGTLDVSTTGVNQNAGDVIVVGNNVTSSGVIKADAINGNGGTIELHATDTTKLTGNSVTSARADVSGSGGSVKVLGNKVGLFDLASVDVSGTNGGGVALIGGDKTGKNTAIRNAEFIYLGNNTSVNADATDNGDGGKLITFASNTARIYGNLYARGGMNGGNGGFVETSGLQGFEITKAPDISATIGFGGEWLIDPFNISIVDCFIANCTTTGNINNSFTAIASGAQLDVNLIYDALDGSTNKNIARLANGQGCNGQCSNGGNGGGGGRNTVTVSTGTGASTTDLGDINFLTTFDYFGDAGSTLKLNAANDINISTNDVRADRSNGSLNIEFNAGRDVLLTNSRIFTNGGIFTATGVNYKSLDSIGGRFIFTAGGNVILTMTGDVKIGSTIFTNGGNVNVSGTGVSNKFTDTAVIYTGNIDTTGARNGKVDIASTGLITLGGTISTDRGSVTLSSSGTGAAGKITVNNSITTNRGAVTVTDSGQFATTTVGTLAGTIDTTGGTGGLVTINSRGAVDLGAGILSRGAKIQVATSRSFNSSATGTINTTGNNGSRQNGDVIINSSGKITVGGQITTLSNNPGTGAGTGKVDLSSSGSAAAGAIVVNAGITTNSGTVNILQSGQFKTALNGIIDTTGAAGGMVAINSTGAVDLAKSITTRGSKIEVASSGSFISRTGGVISTQGASGVIGDGDVVINSTGTITIGDSITTRSTNKVSGKIDLISTSATTVGAIAINRAITTEASKITVKGGNVSTGVNGSINTRYQNASGGNVAITSAGNVLVNGGITTDNGAVDIVATGTFTSNVGGNIDTVNGQNNRVNGTLSIDTAGVIKANGSLVIGGAAIIKNTGSANITLDNVANDFQNTVALTNADGNIIIRDNNTLDFATSKIGTGTLTVNANLGIIQNGGAIVQAAGAGTVILNGGSDSIVLLNPNNDFTGAVQVTNTGLNDVLIQDLNNIQLGRSSIGRDLTVTAGIVSDITQIPTGNNGITVGRDAKFYVDSGRSITLDNNTNKFTGISFLAKPGTGTKLQDVIIANSIGLDLKTLDLTGNLKVTAVGDITNSAGSIKVLGITKLNAIKPTVGTNNISLNSGSNNFTDVVITFGNNVTITDIDTLNIGDANGTVSTINGDLLITTNAGNISQTAALTMNAGSTGTFKAGGTGSILLNIRDANGVALNDFKNVVLNAGGNVDIADKNGINIGHATANNTVSNILGNLTVNANGDITQTAAITMNANTTADFTAGNGQIILGGATSSNNFDKVKLSSSNNVSIRDTAGGIQLGTTTISGTGTLNVVSTGGDISEVANEKISVAGLTTFDAGTADINLGSVIHSFKDVAFTGNNVNLNTDTAFTINDDANGLVSRAGGELNITAVGSISDSKSSGQVVVGRNSLSQLTSTTGDINMVNTDFGGALSASAVNTVTIVDANDLTLGTISAASDVFLTATDAIRGGGSVSANNVQLLARTGINANTVTSFLSAENNDSNTLTSSGDIDISNSGNVEIVSLKNRNSGDITLNNSGDVNIRPSSIDAGYGNPRGVDSTDSTLSIITNANIFGVGPLDAQNNVTRPDIRAHNASFTVGGDFGNGVRPLVLDVDNNVLVNANRSFKPIFVAPGPRTYVDRSAIKLNFFDASAAIAGERLIDLEELEDIDPAIFSDVRNYTYGQVAIRLPRDQLFDDELVSEDN